MQFSKNFSKFSSTNSWETEINTLNGKRFQLTDTMYNEKIFSHNIYTMKAQIG